MSNSGKPTSAKHKILLVDDHVIIRDGLAKVLDAQADFTVVGQAGTAAEAVQMALDLNPDLVLMDIGLPDENGVIATQKILVQRPGMIIIMLTIHDTDELLFAAVRSGAKGYLLKTISGNELVASLRAIHRNEAAISRAMTSRLMNEFSRLSSPNQPSRSMLEKLTLREYEVLKFLAEGVTNQEIASHFQVTESTVKNQIHSILTKLKLKNRRDVIWFARQHGIPEPANPIEPHRL